MVKSKEIYWCWLIAILIMDINDLIRGYWFYHNILSIIFFNLLGIFALYMIIKK